MILGTRSSAAPGVKRAAAQSNPFEEVRNAKARRVGVRLGPAVKDGNDRPRPQRIDKDSVRPSHHRQRADHRLLRHRSKEPGRGDRLRREGPLGQRRRDRSPTDYRILNPSPLLPPPCGEGWGGGMSESIEAPGTAEVMGGLPKG